MEGPAEGRPLGRVIHRTVPGAAGPGRGAAPAVPGLAARVVHALTSV
jgi:hypothetical protein